MDYLLQLLKGVANETRLKMIELLSEYGELSMEDIASRLRIPLATCCRNLKILERVYFVSSRRRQGYMFYQLNRPNEHIYNKLLIDLIKLRKEKVLKRMSR